MSPRKRLPRGKPQTELPGGKLDPAYCIFRNVARTSRAVAALYDAALARAGMSGHQFDLLMTLHRAGPNTVGDLARLVGMDASGVPRAIGPMLRRSWVSVTKGQDRRERIIAIAPSGRKRLMLAIPVWAEAQHAMLDHIGFDNWRNLMLALKSVRDGAAVVTARQ